MISTYFASLARYSLIFYDVRLSGDGQTGGGHAEGGQTGDERTGGGQTGDGLPNALLSSRMDDGQTEDGVRNAPLS